MWITEDNLYNRWGQVFHDTFVTRIYSSIYDDRNVISFIRIKLFQDYKYKKKHFNTGCYLYTIINEDTIINSPPRGDTLTKYLKKMLKIGR